MRFHDPKRQKEDREINDLQEFSDLFIGERCWFCNDARATDINHMAGRNSPFRHHRASLSAACRECHREAIPGMSLSTQLYYKKKHDPDGYDRAVASRLQAAKNGGRL